MRNVCNKFLANVSLLTILSSSLWTLPAQASTYKFKSDKAKIEVPKGWQNAEELFGIPLTILGPEKDGSRPVINVTPTGIAQVKFDAKELEKSQSEYRDGKKQWLDSMKGTAVSFDDYHTEKWTGIDEAHVIGFRYKVAEVEFTEKSYYVLCKDKLYYIKTLMRASQEEASSSTVTQTVKSFKCNG